MKKLLTRIVIRATLSIGLMAVALYYHSPWTALFAGYFLYSLKVRLLSKQLLWGS